MHIIREYLHDSICMTILERQNYKYSLKRPVHACELRERKMNEQRIFFRVGKVFLPWDLCVCTFVKFTEGTVPRVDSNINSEHDTSQKCMECMMSIPLVLSVVEAVHMCEQRGLTLYFIFVWV